MIDYKVFDRMMQLVMDVDNKESELISVFPGYAGDLTSELLVGVVDLLSAGVGESDSELLNWWLWDSNGRSNACIYYAQAPYTRHIDTLPALYDYLWEKNYAVTQY